MTTATFSAPAPATTLRTTARLSFGHVLRSEWVKFRTVRSTWWTMGSTVVVMMLFGVVMAASLNFAPGPRGGRARQRLDGAGARARVHLRAARARGAGCAEHDHRVLHGHDPVDLQRGPRAPPGVGPRSSSWRGRRSSWPSSGSPPPTW
nr:hypothetical protein [Cellulosimicrobium sp. MM]